MNPSSQSETDAIRSDIDVTRQRMDSTIEALGSRLHGRHLVDEFLGFFRRSNPDGSQMKERISQGASNALNSVVDTVKSNPVPALMIGAGIAWMIYNSRKESAPSKSWSQGAEMSGLGEMPYDPDLHVDRPLDYTTGQVTGSLGLGAEDSSQLSGTDTSGDVSAAGGMKEKLGQAGGQLRDKATDLRHRAGERVQAVRHRAGEMSAQARERARMMYSQTRERVATTAHEHPLELGLGILAAGVLVGLALPTAEPVNRIAGPTVDRLRERTREAGREMLEKGRNVARAATEAAKQEAQSQGLTPERLREQAGAIGERTQQAAGDAARNEGLAAGNAPKPSGGNPNDPSLARPAM